MVESFTTTVPSIVGASLVVLSLSVMAIVLLSMFGKMKHAGIAMLGATVGIVAMIGGGIHSRDMIAEEIGDRYGVVAQAGTPDAEMDAPCVYMVHSEAMHSLSEEVAVLLRCI